jgi:hypothetical protein
MSQSAASQSSSSACEGKDSQHQSTTKPYPFSQRLIHAEGAEEAHSPAVLEQDGLFLLIGSFPSLLASCVHTHFQVATQILFASSSCSSSKIH